jgi:quinone-modifying oxidoreductase, subunit QmoC
MSTRVNPGLLPEIKKYGAVNISACFNCGNCTAVCPLSTEGASFPRRMIRYAQVGMEEELLGSKELWLCYFCGECSQTCPRQAEPGNFMAAARKYAIARFDRLGLARLLNTSPALSLLVMVVLAIVLAGFMLTVRGPMDAGSLRLFDFIPYWAIHDLGLGMIAIVFLAGLWGTVSMVLQIEKTAGLPKGVRLNWGQALWQALGVDALGQRRYRQDCETGVSEVNPAAGIQPVAEQPWYLKKWFLHAATMWGFLGLLLATILDYTLDIVGLKPTGAAVPLWYPIRLLGTLAGLLLLYGTSMIILKRLRRADESSKTSYLSDWSFLIMMWLAGASGFILELSLYLPQAPLWGYWVFLFHVAVAMELVLLAPFTKFAHAFYRTLALFLYALKPLPERTPRRPVAQEG